jgi:hypothetical protein
MRGALPSVIDHLLRFGIGSRQDLGVPLLGLSQLLFNFLSVQLRFLDAFSPLFEHGNDRPEREFLQHKVNDDEQDKLGQKLGPLDSEGIEKFLHGEIAAQPKLRSG